MDKNITYYTVLETLKSAKECPLCYLEADAMHAYFDSILYESVNDPKLRSELVRSKGYCHRHAYFLNDMQDCLGIAIMYQDQVQLFKDLLTKKALAIRDRTSEQTSERTSERNDKYICPACRSQAEARQRYLAILMEGLATLPEIQASYETSPGFCMPHLSILLETIKDPAIQNYLYATEERNLTGLWKELQEFIRKNDYRYSNEPFGKERDSWSRAIKKLNGNKAVF